MQQDRSVWLVVTGLLLLGLAGCAADPRTSSPPPPTSQIAQAAGQPAQPPSGVQPPPGTDLPTPLATAGEPGQAAPGELPAGEVQERGLLPIKPRPGVTAPDPSGKAPPPCGAGLPTENIAKVACAFQVKAKSLTTLVVVAPGLALTQPVTISILLGGYAPQRITQSYVASTGNHFLYNDLEGDGKPRRAFADITLTEPKPGGGIYTSTIPGSVMLDPLYDVAVSPLSVKLIDDCDAYGDSDMYVDWYSPDDQYHHIYFETRARNSATTINAFAWARAEVGALANLHVPTYYVSELDPGESIDPNYKGPGPSNVNLVPGSTKNFIAKVDVLTHQKQCRANIQYTITYTL